MQGKVGLMSAPTTTQLSINPKRFDLQLLLPDFLTTTESPAMLDAPELAFLGRSNLRMLIGAMKMACGSLKREIKNLQEEIDNFDLLGTSCVQTMATLYGCTWSAAEPKRPEALAQLSPRQHAQLCKQLPTCQFGQHIADLCKPKTSFCPRQDGDYSTCAQTCFTCFSEKPFAGSPCVFAQNTEEQIDNCIGELIDLENRYADFLDRLEKYIWHAEAVLRRNPPERPRFVRWQSKDYLRVGEMAVHAQIKHDGDGYRVRMHRAYCVSITPDKKSGDSQSVEFMHAASKTLSLSFCSNKVLLG